MSRDYQEKRNYIRMKIDAPIGVTVMSDGSECEGVCRDLSGGGLLIEINKALPVGTEAEVIIASAHGHNPMLRAKAQVTRVLAQPDTETQTCTLGLEITEILN